jgi:hypothetical protein
MKLYLISQDICTGWDTYDSAVVAAENENDARDMHPNGTLLSEDLDSGSWATNPKHVDVEYLGETKREKGVVCASFNAG